MSRMFLAVISAAVIAACANTTPPSPSATAITIWEGGCFYKCTTYEITVQADGRYRLDGQQMTRVAGVSEGQLGAGAFADAERALLAARFSSLPATLNAANRASWQQGEARPCLPHGPGMRITRRTNDGQEKTIHWDQGCRTEQMIELRDRLRQAFRYGDLIAPAK